MRKITKVEEVNSLLKNTEREETENRILTPKYVKQLNDEIAYRIKENHRDSKKCGD